MSINQITKFCRVSEHAVRALREREAVSIAERKQRLASIFGNVAEIGAERMEELAGKASLRDAGTTAGIATDKFLVLIGQTPPSVGVVIMPSETDREERRAIDAKLDASPSASQSRRPVAQRWRCPRSKIAHWNSKLRSPNGKGLTLSRLAGSCWIAI
jgi:hypothetical protein